MRKIFIVLFVFLIACLSACSSRRVITERTSVTDTTHVSFLDTTHVAHVHDTTLVTINEIIREKIVTLYDQQTGLPTRQEVERDIRRRYDSLYLHALDSIRNAMYVDFQQQHADSTSFNDEKTTGNASLSFWQAAWSNVAPMLILFMIIWALVWAFKASIKK